jgi:hypothetical protein
MTNGGGLRERLYGGVIQEEFHEETPLAALPRVFAVDPGESTGWACLWWDPEALWDMSKPIQLSHIAWRAGTISGGSENEQVALVLRHLRKYGSGAEGASLVIEDFTLRKMVTGDRNLLSPVRITAALGFSTWRGLRCLDGEMRRWEYSLQSASDAKNVMTDGRLRDLKMYAEGPDHARDAVRHAALHLRKLRLGGEELFKTMYIERLRGY